MGEFYFQNKRVTVRYPEIVQQVNESLGKPFLNGAVQEIDEFVLDLSSAQPDNLI